GVDRYLGELRRRSVTAARELAPLVQTHRSFEGWFLTEEVDDVNWLPPERFGLLAGYLRDMAETLHGLEPPVSVAVSGFSNAYADPATLEAFWAKLLDRARVDLVLFQDGIGAGKLGLTYASLYLDAVKRATTVLHRTFTVVVELFDQV